MEGLAYCRCGTRRCYRNNILGIIFVADHGNAFPKYSTQISLGVVWPLARCATVGDRGSIASLVSRPWQQFACNPPESMAPPDWAGRADCRHRRWPDGPVFSWKPPADHMSGAAFSMLDCAGRSICGRTGSVIVEASVSCPYLGRGISGASHGERLGETNWNSRK